MKMPPDILAKFEQATLGLDYGIVALSLSIKHGRFRYIITREESILYNDEQSTSGNFYADQLVLSRLLNNQENPEKNCEKQADK